MRRISRAALALSAAFLAASASADEGMWLVNKPPVDILRSKYGFEPTPEWLERIQKSIVRTGGGTGSIVSEDGLVMTNHHVAAGQIAKLSTPERDLLKNGFLARSIEEEIPCKDYQLSVCMGIDDVTELVNAAVTDGMTPAQAADARRKKMTELEQQWQDKSGLNCQVVTLWGGARYHMYQYKRYTDVRLVMAPEEAAAAFGGDVDNFEFPRYCYDATFLRLYEDGKPAKTPNHLSWSPSGVREGDLAFVFGHPGRTRRSLTVEHLADIRDRSLPETMNNTWRREVQLQTFSGISAEHERIARNSLRGVQNGRKANTGRLQALQEPAVMADKTAAEKRLREWVNADPARKAKWGNGWELVSQAVAAAKRLDEEQEATSRVLSSTLGGYALTIVRLAQELPKPSGERLREYRDTALPSLYVGLYSPAPIYDELEIHTLATSLSAAAMDLGMDHPAIQQALAGKSPQARAVELIKGSSLKDIATRKKLVEGGIEAVKSSDDPLIKAALAIEPALRAQRKASEDAVEAPQREGYARLAEARFALDGENVYPDATGTLRMSFGPIQGYVDGGEEIEPFTVTGGKFARAEMRGHQPPFAIADSWEKAKDELDMKTPFNFTLTADVIGGNSGSPVVNTQGEVIGLIFDGNIHSLGGDFFFDERLNRSIAVDSRILIEAMRKVYGLDWLADELETGKRAR